MTVLWRLPSNVSNWREIADGLRRNQRGVCYRNNLVYLLKHFIKTVKGWNLCSKYIVNSDVLLTTSRDRGFACVASGYERSNCKMWLCPFRVSPKSVEPFRRDWTTVILIFRIYNITSFSPRLRSGIRIKSSLYTILGQEICVLKVTSKSVPTWFNLKHTNIILNILVG